MYSCVCVYVCAQSECPTEGTSCNQQHKKDRPAAAAAVYLLIDCAFCVDTTQTMLLELIEIA